MATNDSFVKQTNQFVYPNENYPFILDTCEKKLDSIYGQSSSRFKDKHWFQTKRKVQMHFLQNQHLNIMYTYVNYMFVLTFMIRD